MPAEPSTASQRLWHRCWPPAALALLAVAFNWRLLMSATNEIIHGADIMLYFQWLHTYIAEEFREGRIPLWNPFNYCGMPFAANPQATVFYPLSWLHLLMPAMHAHKYLFVMHTWLAGSFMYMYLRQIGSSRSASFVTCLPYMLGNYLTANVAVGHLTVLFTATWLPLIMWAYERALVSGRLAGFMLTGLLLGVQVLAGEPQSSFYTSLLLTLYGLLRVCIMPSDRGQSLLPHLAWRWGAGLIVVAVVSACASAIQLLPTAEFAANSDRGTPTYEFATFNSLAPASLLEFIMPWTTDHTAGLIVDGVGLSISQEWEYGGYVGIMPLALAFAAPAARDRRIRWVVFALLGFSLILVLGQYTPIYRGLYHLIPGLGLFRVPVRAMLIAQWALAASTALGMDWVMDDGAQRWKRGTWRLLAIAGVLCAAVGFLGLICVTGMHWIIFVKQGALDISQAVSLKDGRIQTVLVCLTATLGALVVMGWLGRRAAISLMLVTLGVDLSLSRARIPLITYAREGEPGFKLLTAWSNQPDAPVHPYRVDVPPREIIADTALGARVECVNGYFPLAVDRFYRYVHWMRNGEPSKVSRFELPQSLYLADEPDPLNMLNLWAYTRWDYKTNVFVPSHNRRVLPRAWIVDKSEVIPDEQAMLNRLRDPGVDLSRLALFEKPPRVTLPVEGLTSRPPGVAVANRLQPSVLEIRTESFRPGYLVLSEVWYPGWRATIDGAPVDLERVNFLLPALSLPAGSHIVRYEFAPRSFVIGAWCSGITAGMVTIVAILSRLRRPSPTAEPSPSPFAPQVTPES